DSIQDPRSPSKGKGSVGRPVRGRDTTSPATPFEPSLVAPVPDRLPSLLQGFRRLLGPSLLAEKAGSEAEDPGVRRDRLPEAAEEVQGGLLPPVLGEGPHGEVEGLGVLAAEIP